MANALKLIHARIPAKAGKHIGMTLGALLIIGQSIYAQAVADANGPTNPTLVNVFPGKPAPGSLGTFNNSQVNYFTGAVSYNVPIFKYKGMGNNLQFDIALSYTGGGGIRA